MTAALALLACGPKSATTPPKPKASPTFPTGYTSWKQINARPIIRTDEGVAWEVYARSAPELGVGTTLVKEQHALVDGREGAITKIAVMRRTGGSANSGWTFASYNPRTHARMGRDETACIGCHTLRADHDYLFEPRAKLLP